MSTQVLRLRRIEMSENIDTTEMSENLNWLTTQNRNLLARVQQLEAILNAVQKQSPEALSFLQEAPISPEVGEEIREGEEPANESEEEEA